MRKMMDGVTLIELMVVVVIIAIIMGFGVPSYRQYTMRANRVDATSTLLRVAAAQERWFITNGQYATTQGELNNAPPAGLGITGSERGFYNVAVAPAAGGPAVGYTVSAIADPAERQADDTGCRSFTLNERGQRAAFDNGGADATEECWR
jgi:type IV pilus assembly protein PilE